MIFGRGVLGNFELTAEKQWLVTNGLGGFASSTPSGANTSKYHGLLFAALKPPGERTLMLAKLDETLYVDGREFRLGANRTGDGVYPEGYLYLHKFELNPFPTYTYSVQGMFLEKVVFMVPGSNTTVVRYALFGGPEKQVTLQIRPFVNCRHYHHTVRKNDWLFNQQAEEPGTVIEAYPGAPKLRLYSDRARYYAGDGNWFEGLYYPLESERGLDAWEDHYMPGYFEIGLTDGGSFGIIASTEEEKLKNPLLLQISAERRLAQLVEQAGYQQDFVKRLVVAADAFIVHRQSTGTKSIIAGYPWFTDWGRDTMIALPGLTLVTRRFGEAKEIIQTFARYCKDGLIPNMFPDEGGEPLYNTVDASLWFFHAVYKYLQYTGDHGFIRNVVYPVLQEIIEAYRMGTHFNIGMDADGLIYAGAEGAQLTWMDAKVGDWVVTPRQGKAVEINALWYNALMVMAWLAKTYGADKARYSTLADKVRRSFEREFWNPDKKCLYDVIRETKDDAVRPNQIIAVALPFTMLDHSKEVAVVNTVWRELYFSYGLRSLAPGHPEFKGVYRGDVVARDAAYHQGTGWSWLIGPFITAYRKVNDYSPASREVAQRFIAPFKAHLSEHGLNSISEIYDGDPPHKARGCFAQAWGVAEVLRAYVEDVLEIKPDKVLEGGKAFESSYTY